MLAEAVPAHSVTDVESYDAVVVGGGLYGGAGTKTPTASSAGTAVCSPGVRCGSSVAGRPLWFFSSGPLDASATEKEIPPVLGVRRVMTRLGARAHVTFGGCLEEGAKGFVARKIVSSGKGGDYRDFGQIEVWAMDIGTELVSGARSG